MQLLLKPEQQGWLCFILYLRHYMISQVPKPTCFWKSGGDHVYIWSAPFSFASASVIVTLKELGRIVSWHCQVGRQFKKTSYKTFQSFLIWSAPECDIRENLDTNEYPNIFESKNLHERISEYIRITNLTRINVRINIGIENCMNIPIESNIQTGFTF